jgi:hypothetical protein
VNTDDDPTPDPPEDDSSQDDESSDGGARVEAEPVAGKRFRTARPEELAPQSFIVSDERAAGRLRLFGGSVQGVRANAEFCGEAIRRLARTLKETARSQMPDLAHLVEDSQLRSARLGHSIVIELEIGLKEELAVQLDGTTTSPTLRAAHTLSELLAAQPDQLVDLALSLSHEATREYRQFLKVLGNDDVTVEWLVPRSDRYVVTTSKDLRADHAILVAEGQEQTKVFYIPGTLTMADSMRDRFELRLMPPRDQAPFFKGKTSVKGKYDEAVGDLVKAQGLWDTEVLATIEVTYDELNSTVTPRPYAYRLVAATPRPTTPTLLDDLPL